MESSNSELLHRCRAGDSTAWQLLVQRYGRLVHSVPVRYGLDSGDVDEVGQEVFWALAQQLDRIEDAERLGGWLMTTARRMSWRLIQQRKQDQPAAGADVADGETPGGEVVGVARVPTVAELVVGWDRQEALQMGMARLGERCRYLLQMLFLDSAEPSYDEISAHLGMPKGSIGPTRNRCLVQLRAILDELGYTDIA